MPVSTPASSTSAKARTSRAESTAWYAVLACVALLPVTTSITHGAIAGLYSYTQDAYHVPKLALLLAGAAVATVAWVADVVAGRRVVRMSRTFIALAAFVLLTAASTALAPEPLSSLFGASGLMTGLITWLLSGWTAVLVSQYVTGGKRLTEISWALVGGSAALGLIAVLQALGLDPVRTAVGEGQEWMVARGMATLGNPDYVGAFLVIPTLVAMSAVLHATTSRSRATAITAAAIIAGGMFVTLTRAAWIGVIVGIAALVFLTSQDRSTLARRARTVGGLAALAAVAGTLIVGPGNVLSRISSVSKGLDAFSSGRITLWTDTLRVIADHPLWGTGADRLALGAYRVQDEVIIEGIRRFVMQDPHSLPLLAAGVFGIPAATALLAALVMALVSAWKQANAQRDTARSQKGGTGSQMLYAGWVAGLLGFLVTSLLSVYTISTVFVLFLGVGVVLAPSLRAAEARWLRAALVAFAACLIVVAAYGTTMSLRASYHAAYSRVGDTKFELEEAIRLTPWDSKARTDYLWRKINSVGGTLQGADVTAAHATADALEAEIRLNGADFPEELLFFRLRVDLHDFMKGHPGYRPERHKEALDEALEAFPDDPEFTERSQDLEQDS